jgi:fructosamine-3-kinase
VTRQPIIAKRAEQILGGAVVATAPMAGGDTATATKLRLSDGSTALMKTHPQPPTGFFGAEMRGLRWLREAGGVPVPDILGGDEDCLILRWIEPGRASPESAATFGRALATTHTAGAPEFGGPHDGFIGMLPLVNRSCASWGEFFVTRRILPYLKLARDRAAISSDQATVIENVASKLDSMIPVEKPSRLHGDLWNGNVLWGNDGQVWVVDPAAFGGHRESDLAMLALFGLPHLSRVLEAYEEMSPLEEGWQDRLKLHQLYPLLVHAAAFGGGFGARAAAGVATYA